MEEVLDAVEAALLAEFGADPARASVSFVGLEQLDVLRFEPEPGERCYVTLGMSRHPMTPASAAVLGADGPRAELLLRLHDPIDAHSGVWRQLAVLAAAPAVEGVVHRAGTTTDLGEPLVPGARCVGVVVVTSGAPDVTTPAGPVQLLRAIPATSTELAWCRVHGAALLRERWEQHGTDLLDLARGPVPLR